METPHLPQMNPVRRNLPFPLHPVKQATHRPPPASQEPASQEETEVEAGNTLVVYFSATGNTEQAATYIADITGGDLFELEPADPYTDEDLNYNNEDSRVSQEYADESLRDVELVSDTV